MMNNVNSTPAARTDREGFALVTTVLVVLVLSVLAVAVAFLASAEKKTSFAEGVHVSSVFSADAGGEAAINFLRVSTSPPQITDFADSTVHNQPTTAVQGSQSYLFDAQYRGMEVKAGWTGEYMDFVYEIGSSGTASIDGESSVDLVATRLFKN
ncbi:MAG: hypothetical protein GY838_13760 [bacterium]|nr:hypothetical protein [bacterium]